VRPLDSIEPIQFNKLLNTDQQLAYNLALSKIRRNQQQLDNQQQFLTTLDRETDLYWIEFHRKFALTYAIVVLFFVGAPLGALIKKGGFGAPVVIAGLIFMLYFILSSVGDNLADTGTVSPAVGMWMAAVVFTPVAFFFTKKALSV
jgi:lipopolysaccharide export system permease protein